MGFVAVKKERCRSTVWTRSPRYFGLFEWL